MTLADLERVAPAFLPHRSETARPIDWDLLHGRLGTVLPADYREYCSYYPPLSIDDFMSLLVVRPGREERWVAMQAEELDVVKSLDDDEMPEHYTFHPDPGGLLLWGTSNEGDMFFWRNSGSDPDQWPAVVFTRNSDWWEHEGGALSLVVGLIDGSVEHWGLPPQPGPNPTVTA